MEVRPDQPGRVVVARIASVQERQHVFRLSRVFLTAFQALFDVELFHQLAGCVSV